MAHDSRILIADLMFPSEHVTANDLSIATFDITMFNMGGKERSESDFRTLLENVGCELVKVWRSETGFGVIVEGRLKGSAERVVDQFVADEKEEASAAAGAADIPTAAPAVTEGPQPVDPIAATVSEATQQSGPLALENGNTGDGDHPAIDAAASEAEKSTPTAAPDNIEVNASGATNGRANALPSNEPVEGVIGVGGNGVGEANGSNGNDGR